MIERGRERVKARYGMIRSKFFFLAGLMES